MIMDFSVKHGVAVARASRPDSQLVGRREQRMLRGRTETALDHRADSARQTAHALTLNLSRTKSGCRDLTPTIVANSVLKDFRR